MSSIIGVAALLFGLLLVALNASCLVLPFLIWKAVNAGEKERQSRLSALLAAAFLLSASLDWLISASIIGLSRMDG